MQQSENARRAWVPYLILIPITLPIVMMYTWLFVSSFSTGMQGIIPQGFTLDNWRFLWETKQGAASIWAYAVNTFLFAACVTVVELLVASLAAYAISRLNFPGRRLFLSFVIILHAFPSITLIIAIFFILRMLDLYDTLTGVIVVKVAFELPFAIWIMKGFFDNVPWDLEIAAMVDGASRWNVWRKVVMPVVRPGLAALAVFAFLTGWSEFMIPFLFAPNSSTQTLSVFLNMLTSQADEANYGLVTAVGLFYILPVLIFYALTQKYLLNIFSGGVKG